MPYIAISNVEVRIKRSTILHDISVSFGEGKISGIVGRNGSGKSMLLKSICGFLRPNKGSIVIQGIDYYKARKFPMNLGFIIEAPALFPDLSAYENLHYLMSVRKKPSKEAICGLLSTVGLDAKNRKCVRKYSMGMKQRLGLAQAIMDDPDLIILDEPMNGLDNQGVEDMRSIIRGMAAQGKTIVLTSHNPLDIHVLCDDVFEMEAGSLRKALSWKGGDTVGQDTSTHSH